MKSIRRLLTATVAALGFLAAAPAMAQADARMAEAFGLDVEVHAVGPAHRHVMGAVRNSNWHEVALVRPDCPNVVPPVYTCGYTDQIDCIDRDGTVPAPDGPGLGVKYDWDFINRNAKARHVYGCE